MRGGSRPGLTKYSVTDFGGSIDDMISIDTSTAASGTEETLVVLNDSALSTATGGTASSVVGYMLDSGGDILTSAGGDKILISSASAPATGYLIAGQQMAYAVGTSAITKMDPKARKIEILSPSAGTVPTNTTFGAIYRDRMFLAGGDNTIFCRQNNHSSAL